MKFRVAAGEAVLNVRGVAPSLLDQGPNIRAALQAVAEARTYRGRGEMIPFDFAKSIITAASDFEETAQRVAHGLGVDVEDLKQRAVDLSGVSGRSPIEALHHFATARRTDPPAEEEA